MLIAVGTFAQRDRYVVHFTDKVGSPFSVNSPLAFLSERSLQRRQRNSVAVTEEDLPVNPSYLQSLRSAGCTVLFSSRWFNCTLVEADVQQISAAGQLSMVRNVERVAPLTVGSTQKSNSRTASNPKTRTAEYSSQLLMLGIDQMHADGWTGSGIMIAVMDSGFPDVSSGTGFQSLVSNNRIKDSYNFAWQRKDVFGFDDHGTSVLSILAAELGDQYIGALPDADYLLYATEYVPSEYRVEEYNWLFAAERADSAGADVINTSLGYTTFDDATMNYTYDDMDGATAVISRAASLAAARGMVVVVSSGNGGGSNWPFIGAPADAEAVLSVGSVSAEGTYSPFSSRGPSSDGRVKPDVSAMGASTMLLAEGSVLATGSGTSFSSPLISGLAGGIIQSRPEATAAEIRDLIRSAGSLSSNPDNLLGYGIPNYNDIRVISSIEKKDRAGLLRVFPNPVSSGTITIETRDTDTILRKARLISPDGRSLQLQILPGESAGSWVAQIPSVGNGVYVLHCFTDHSTKFLSTRLVVH